MSLSACDAKLAAVTRELANRWAQTSAAWRDQKRDDFARKYLAELFTSVGATRSVIGELDELIARIRKECE